MCADDLLMLIEDYYYYLSEEYGFSHMLSNSLRNDEMCFVVLTSSSSCKIRITSEMGLVNMFWGKGSAPDTWGDEGWYYLGSILDYLEDIVPDLEEKRIEDNHLRNLSVQDRQKYWAKRLESKIEQVIGLFARGNSRDIQLLENYIRDYQREIGKQFRERYI